MPEFKFQRDHQKDWRFIKVRLGWIKKLNLISWNERDPKYDIRDWGPDGEKMGKGVTLSKEELQALKDLLNSLEL